MFLSRLTRTLVKFSTNTIQSNIIIDPHFYQRRDLVSKVQNYFANKSALNDIERSFRDFKRSEVKERYLLQYNQFVEAFRREKFNELEEYLSPTLFKDFKKAMKAKEELPYFFETASSCELVQARGYSQSLAQVKSTNRWYQLTLKYKMGEQEAFHILQRSDKHKHFKFIKFYL